MNEKINQGGPAFPFVEFDGDGKPAAIETGMTLRQYAAIKLRVPNSGTDWLDAMIRETLRDYFAAKAMQGILSHHGVYDEDAHHHSLCSQKESKDRENAVPFNQLSGYAYSMADEMLKAREAAPSDSAADLLSILRLCADFLYGPTAWTHEQEEFLCEQIHAALAKAVVHPT